MSPLVSLNQGWGPLGGGVDVPLPAGPDGVVSGRWLVGGRMTWKEGCVVPRALELPEGSPLCRNRCRNASRRDRVGDGDPPGDGPMAGRVSGDDAAGRPVNVPVRG